MKIGTIVDARSQTKTAKATAVTVAAQANQAVTVTTAADDAQESVEAKALQKIGPTVIGSTLYDSPDGAVVHETPVNGPDADVPDDPAPVPAPTDPNALAAS